MSPSSRALGVTGTAVEDTIERPDGSRTEDMGGIYHAVLALHTLLPDDVRAIPVLAVGEDAIGRVRADFAALGGVATEGIVAVPETNNKVRLVYRGGGERDETLTGGVRPLAWPDLEPWIDRLDVWLWNFVAGDETDRETFARVKRAFAGPVHLDVHSLCLEPPDGGPRRRRRPERWEAWVEGATWVQCNEWEAGLLWRGEDRPLDPDAEAALAGRVRALGAEGLLVTRGERGATWHGAEGRRDAPARDVESAVDPTGCGDVAGAAWVALKWARELDAAAALEGVVAAAGAAAGTSGTRGLADAIRERPISPNGGER